MRTDRADDGRTEELRLVLRRHHPVMRSETGPFSGCRCGGVRLGQDVIQHVLDHLLAALKPAPGADTCSDCGRTLTTSHEERTSGLCLRCLNGPPPGADTSDEYAGHRFSCRIFYAEHRCTCVGPPIPGAARFLGQHDGQEGQHG